MPGVGSRNLERLLTGISVVVFDTFYIASTGFGSYKTSWDIHVKKQFINT
jgi:hypothetical protein